MKVHAHLTFDGQCEAAFRFYERCFAGTIVTLLSYGDTPMAQQVPEAWRTKIVHATLRVGDAVLMGADLEHYERPRGIFVLLEIEDPAAAELTFAALAEGGTVQMPLQKTFWAARFGVVVDRFGIPWEINCAA